MICLVLLPVTARRLPLMLTSTSVVSPKLLPLMRMEVPPPALHGQEALHRYRRAGNMFVIVIVLFTGGQHKAACYDIS